MVDQAGDDLPKGQAALAGVAQGVFDAELAGQVESGPDGADRETLAQPECGLLLNHGLQIALVTQSQANGLDFVRRTSRQVGNSLVLDLAILAKRAAQKMSPVGFAVDGNG